jgi:hypothetical protein
MKFRTHTAGPINSQMTSMQGTIQATLLELTSVFGRPFANDPATTGKSNYRWQIMWDDETVATIYDWHQPEFGPNDTIAWHIGGYTSKVRDMVHEEFRQGHVALRKAA